MLKYNEFLNENAYFNKFQYLKELIYDINSYGKYRLYKSNWFIYNDKDQKVGNYYLFIDNNKTLIIDKLNFDVNMEETKEEKTGHAKLFMKQLIDFCNEHKLIAAVSPDRIRDRKSRKKIKSFYEEFGFVPNKGKTLNPIITETMYKQYEKL